LGRCVVYLVIDLVVLERGSKRCGDGSWNPISLMSVVEDVQEGEGGIFVDCGCDRGVDEVPCRANVGVRNIKRII